MTDTWRVKRCIIIIITIIIIIIIIIIMCKCLCNSGLGRGIFTYVTKFVTLNERTSSCIIAEMARGN